MFLVYSNKFDLLLIWVLHLFCNLQHAQNCNHLIKQHLLKIKRSGCEVTGRRAVFKEILQMQLGNVTCRLECGTFPYFLNPCCFHSPQSRVLTNLSVRGKQDNSPPGELQWLLHEERYCYLKSHWPSRKLLRDKTVKVLQVPAGN